jgi:hypothetical protein
MKNKIYMRFLLIFIFLCIFFNYYVIGLPDQLVLAFHDDDFDVLINFDGKNVLDSLDESDAISLDPDVDVLARLEYLVESNRSVEVEKLKTVFSLADVDAVSKTNELGFTLSPGENFTFIQTWKFKNYVWFRNIGLISGVYRVRYDLYYSSNGVSKVLKGIPFYVRFSGNPITSVFGAMATIALTQAGVSLLGLVNSMRKSIEMEVNKAIESTKVSPTEKLKGYYKGMSYRKVQNEVSKIAYGHATNLLRGDQCPQCGTKWLEDQDKCINCQLTLEEARDIYSKSLGDRSLKASKEVVDSVSGLSLSNIAHRLGEGVVPTTSIISVLIFSGLAIAQPRVAKSWAVKTRKLVFTGLRTTLFSLFWIQACGIATVSLVMLIIAILSGFFIPFVISKVLGSNIKTKVSEFWSSKKLLIRSTE